MKYNNNLIQDVCCPFCKANEGIALYTVTASEAATHFVLPWQHPERHKHLEQHIRNLWNQNTCQLICCKSCAGVFSWPFVAGDKRFYDLAYDRSGYPQEKWEYKIALNWVVQTRENYNISEITALEIGAGNGAFIKKLIAAGANSKNICAIEYSDMGRKELETMNLSFVSFDRLYSNKELLNAWKNKFDFIFMFQVLEHLDNLDSQLNFLSLCLRDKGQLIFAVPNLDQIYFNELNGALLDMPPNHISRFTEDSVQKLAKRNLFEVKYWEVEPLDSKLKEFKMFCRYRYLRSTQSRHTIASLISRLPSRWKIRGLFRKLYLGLSLPVNAMYLAKIKSGSSQLSVLQKI